ncbi:hypothetical protein D9M71_380100 [compost metagenome]
MVEHDEILLAAVLLAAQQLLAWYIQQLDGHATGIADAVELRVGIAVGQANPGLPLLAGLGEDALTHLRAQVLGHCHFGCYAAMGLGVGIAQISGTAAVLVDDANSGLDDVLGHGRFIRRDLLLGRNRAGFFPGVPEAGQQPGQQAERHQPQQRFDQASTKP